MIDPGSLRPPPSFTAVAGRLESAGFQAWAVGGALRDNFLGIDRGDWDLATDARPEQVLDLFRRTVPLGLEHGTVGVLDPDGDMYEVTTFRKDVETDGRHATVEYARSIDEDLARRDFTINAIAWRESTGELRDPWNGRADLDAGILRAVGDPAERFAEDYLRVLRALRFAGGYRLTMDPPTREALEKAVPGLARLSAERVREELLKVLRGAAPSAGLQLYRDTGALAAWYPELEARSNDQAWDDALAAVDQVSAGRPLLRFCRLLVLVPEPDETEGRAGAASLLVERLKFSRAEQRRVLHLHRHYLPFVSAVDSTVRIREWLSEVGAGTERDLFRLHIANARAAGAHDVARQVAFTWRRVHEQRLSGVPIDLEDLALDGNDLLSMGLAPGPLVGLVLEELHARVLEDPDLNERDSLLGVAQELIEMTGGAR